MVAMSYTSYWWIRQQLSNCDLLTSESDQIMCKASVLARAEQRGMRGVYQYRQAQAQVVEQQRAAIESNTLIIAALLIGGAILFTRK